MIVTMTGEKALQVFFDQMDKGMKTAAMVHIFPS